jgi:hypothetical protein
VVAHGSEITASNTGYTAYTSPTLGRPLVSTDLTTITGRHYISDYDADFGLSAATPTSPAIVEAIHFTGEMCADVDNIIFRGCSFDTPPLPQFNDGNRNIRFEWCTVDTFAGGNGVGAVCIGDSYFSAYRCRLESCSDGIRANGGLNDDGTPFTQVITECLIRNLRMASSEDHNDGGQTDRGSGIVRYERCKISAVIAGPDLSATGNATGGSVIIFGDMDTPGSKFRGEVIDCDLTGGNYALYLQCGGNSPQITYKVTGNTFTRGQSVYGPVTAGSVNITPPGQITWYGNTYSDNGEVIPYTGALGPDGATVTRARSRTVTPTATRSGAAVATATRSRSMTATVLRSGAGAVMRTRTRTTTAAAVRSGAAAVTRNRGRSVAVAAVRSANAVVTRTRVRGVTATALRSIAAAVVEARSRTVTPTAARSDSQTGTASRSRTVAPTAVAGTAGQPSAVVGRSRSTLPTATLQSPARSAPTRGRSVAAVASRSGVGTASPSRIRSVLVAAVAGGGGEAVADVQRSRSVDAVTFRSSAATAVAPRSRTVAAQALTTAPASSTLTRSRSVVAEVAPDAPASAVIGRSRSVVAAFEPVFTGPFSTRSYIVVERPGFTTEDGFVGVAGSTYGDSELGETVYGDAPMWPSRKSWVEVG